MNLATQCEKADIPSLMYLPSDAQLVADSYSLVVDAIFGIGYEPPMSSDFAAIVQTITRSKVPVVSIDVPSGQCLLAATRTCSGFCPHKQCRNNNSNNSGQSNLKCQQTY